MADRGKPRLAYDLKDMKQKRVLDVQAIGDQVQRPARRACIDLHPRNEMDTMFCQSVTEFALPSDGIVISERRTNHPNGGKLPGYVFGGVIPVACGRMTV